MRNKSILSEASYVISQQLEDEELEVFEYIKKYSEIVLLCQNPNLSFKFCKNIVKKLEELNDVDKTIIDTIRIHGEVVYRYGDQIINTEFAKKIPGCDVNIHLSTVLKYNDVVTWINFANNVNGVNKKRIESKVLRMIDPVSSSLYAMHVSDANVKAHENIILTFLSLNKEEYKVLALEFAKYVKGVDIKRIEKHIIRCKDVEASIYFIRNFEDCDREKHMSIIAKYATSEQLFKFLEEEQSLSLDETNMLINQLALLNKIELTRKFENK